MRVLAAFLAAVMVAGTPTVVASQPLGCNADWQCPHDTSCVGNVCVPTPKPPDGNPNNAGDGTHPAADTGTAGSNGPIDTGANTGGYGGPGYPNGFGGGVPPAAPLGVPYSIELVVEGGANPVADNMHPIYRPGSQVHLKAIVRDAAGNVVTSGCNPDFKISDNVAADRGSRAVLNGDTVTFGQTTGVFTVTAYCRLAPNITSERNQAPINFETATNRFARCTGCACTDECSPAIASQGKHRPPIGKIVLTAVLLSALVALTYTLASGSGGGGGCYCVEVSSSTNGSCPAGKYPFLSQSDCLNGPMGLSYLESFCQCRVAMCTVTFAPSQCGPCACPAQRTQPLHSVEELVAFGMTRQPVRAQAPVRSVPIVARTASAHGSGGNDAVWVGAAIAAGSLLSTAYALWAQSRPQPPRTEVIPSITPNGGGVTLIRRF